MVTLSLVMGVLVGDGDGLLLERVHVGDTVDGGDQEVEPGAERLEILPPTSPRRKPSSPGLCSRPSSPAAPAGRT